MCQGDHGDESSVVLVSPFEGRWGCLLLSRSPNLGGSCACEYNGLVGLSDLTKSVRFIKRDGSMGIASSALAALLPDLIAILIMFAMESMSSLTEVPLVCGVTVWVVSCWQAFRRIKF